MKKLLLTFCTAVMVATMSLQARTILINDGFENGIQDSVWTQEFASGNTPWAVEDVADGLTYPATVYQGSKRAYLRNNTGETQGYVTRLVSKVMDLRPTKVYMPELTFFYANPKWGADRDTLRVLYRTSSRGAWKVMAEYGTASANWQKVKLSLPEVSQTYQIAFEGTDNLGHGIVLDSVKLQSAPECTIPYDLLVTNKGAGKVNVAWTASYDADFYELVVCKDTIDPDTASLVPASRMAFHGLVSDVTNQDLTLESGEFYLMYVRSLCENENSAWSSEASGFGPFGFRVRTTKMVPFTEKFNGVSSSMAIPRLEEWTWSNNTGNANPYINAKTTSAQARGYYSPDSTAAVIFSGGTVTSPSTFIPADRYVYLTTPALADTTNEHFSISQCQVHFWSTVYTYTGRQYGRSIIVGVMDDPDDITTFTPVDTVTVWDNRAFVESIVDLGSYRGTGSFLAFVSDFDRQNLFYIDNVTVEYRRNVNKVTKISVNPRDTFATISWEGNASSYQVLVTDAVVNPANPGSAHIIDNATVTGNSYVCENLEPNHSWNKPYYVYVLAEGSEWSYRYPFVTLASKQSIPYSWDFEAQNTPVYNISGDNSNYAVGLGVFGNMGAYPAVVSNSSNSYAGSGYLYLNKPGGKDAWITLPMVDNLNEVQVKFYLSGGSTYDQAHATVGVVSNPMDINSFVPVSSFALNASGYTRCYANFENYSGPEGVIAIVWDDVANMSKNTINYIDQITVEELSNCVPPTNIDLEIEPDSVTVRWENTSLANEWEFFLSRAALTASQRIQKTLPEIARIGGVVVADTLRWDDPLNKPTFGFGDLIPHAKYYLYVRATCDMEWWSEVAFTTPCQDETFPYKETFESYNVGSTSVGCWQLADFMGVDYPRIYQAGSTTSSNKVLELYSSGTTHRSAAILPKVEGNLSDMLLTLDVRTSSTSSSASGVLYIGSMGDITSSSSFVPFDTIYVSGGSGFTTHRLVLADYQLAYDNIAITSGLGTLRMSSDVLVDNVKLTDPSCIEAYDFRFTNVGPHDFDVSWSGSSTNDEWRITVLSVSASMAAVKNGTYDKANEIVGDSLVVGRNCHIEGLQAQHAYYVYIHALCGDSLWTSSSVETTCELLDPAKANRETFESYANGSVPDCWTIGSYSTYSDYIPQVVTTTYYSASGSKSLKVSQPSPSSSSSYYNYGNPPSWVVSPQIKCDSLSSVMVSFAVYISSSMILGVMTDPDDLSTFVTIDSIRGSSSINNYSYDLSDYASIIPKSAKYIAWRGPMKTYNSFYLDDVSFVSVACPLPRPSVSDLAIQSARISSGLRTDDSWILLVTNKEVTEENLVDEDFVIPASWIITRDTISTRSHTVTGLEGQTKYYVAVATLCEDSVLSQWRTISFMTPCTSITPEQLGTVTFSEEEGFELNPGGETPCWTMGNKSPDVNQMYIPYVLNASTMMHDNNRYLRIFDYFDGDVNAIGAYAIMPQMDVDDISKYQVTFWGRSPSSTSYNNQLIVGIVTDPSDLNTFVALDTLNLSRSNWDPYAVGFENYEGDFMGDKGKYIMFLSEFGMTNDAYISEVSVELIPSCRPVGSFSVDSVGEKSAVISWKGYQDTYRLLVANRALKDSEKESFIYLLDTMVNSSDEVLIEGLQPATSYYIYAQGICDDGDVTPISTTYAAIKTDCPTEGGAGLPFYDDFESYEDGEKNPGCWLMKWKGSSRPSFFYVRELSDLGIKAIDVWNSAYMVVPRVNGNLENLKLTVDARSYYGNRATKLYVGVMADPDDATTFVLIHTFDLAATEAFTHCEVELGQYELPFDNLVITSGISNVTPDTYDNYVDAVGLELTATCNSPKLTSLSTSFFSAELRLTPANAEDTQWQIVVIPDSVYTNIGDINSYLASAEKILVESSQISLSNLQPATSYNIFARTLCSSTDISSWTRNPLKITTQYYYADSYSFGFEKTELWERSQFSTSDNYYIHPALVTGQSEEATPTEAMIYYPHSRENTSSQLYARTGNGALMMHAYTDTYGGYVIFPAVGEAKARSFEFKLRPGCTAVDPKLPQWSFDANLELGTIERDKGFETYEPMALIRLDQLASNVTAKSKNNMLFSNYSIDLDSATIATRQLVFHLPKQPYDSAFIFVDDVALTEEKGFSFVSLDRVVAGGNNALIQWRAIGGPWNLTIKKNGTTVQTFSGLTGTSQLVEGLDPLTDYTAELASASVPTAAKNYVTSDKLTFRTLCLPLDPSSIAGDYTWDFDNAFDWEANDVLAGETADSLYFKPACFQVGITYPKAVNGYQWLIQRKGYETSGALAGYSASRHLEVGRDDSHALRIHTTSTNYNSYLILPEMNSDLDTMMIEFYGRCFTNYDDTYATESFRGRIANTTYLGEDYSRSIVVGALSDPADWSTLHILDTLTYTQSGLTTNDNVADDPTGLRYWELMQMPLTGAEGKFIVLFQPAPGLFYLDNLAVKPIGNTLFAPINTRIDAITPTSAQLSWSVRQPSYPTVVVLVDGYSEQEIRRDTILGTSYTLDNLDPATMYQWYVFQTDTAHNSESSRPISFATECVQITPDYTCGFEPYEGWRLIDGQTSGLQQTLCWTYGDALRSTWSAAAYIPYNQANNKDDLYSFAGTTALSLKATYSARGTSYQPYVAMPEMDITAYDTLQVSFWMRPAFVSAETNTVTSSFTGSTYAKSIIVGTMTDPTDAATFVPLDTVTYDGSIATTDVATAANNYLFQQMKVELVGATGPHVAFMTSFQQKGSTSQKTFDFLYLDDILFERKQECKEPKDLVAEMVGSTHADLHWNGIDSAGSYNLQVSTDPYFADEDAFVFNGEVESTSTRVKGLKQQTTYVWRVQALCGERWGESAYSAKATFTTSRSPYFLEEFATTVNANEWIFSKAHADNVIDSTGAVSKGSVDNWSFLRTTTNYGLTGPHYAAPGYQNDFHWMVTPNFYLPEEDSVHFSMDLALTACNSAHTATGNAVTENDMKDDYYFMIIVSDDGGKTWQSKNILAKWQNTNPSGMQLRDIPTEGMSLRYSLAPYAGKNVRIGLYREAKTSSSTGITIHVDNIRLGYYKKTVDYTTGCQYEDITIGDIHLSGEQTMPGIHSYPTCYYASDADAKAGALDSVHQLEIEIFPAMEYNIKDTICEGDAYTDFDFMPKTETGIYRRKLQTVEHGCDSIVTLDLYVKPRRYGEDTEATICKGEPFEWHGQIYNRAGIYRDTMVSSIGCDSIEALILSYVSDQTSDTIYVLDSITTDELPFSYEDPTMHYAQGQAPIYYPAGTPEGTYIDTVRMQGSTCEAVLVHTLVIADRHEAIDDVRADKSRPRKIVYHDQLYIILNDEWYNVSGQKVEVPRD